MSGSVSVSNVSLSNGIDEDEDVLKDILDHGAELRDAERMDSMEELIREYISRLKMAEKEKMRFLESNTDRFIDSEQNIFDDNYQSKLVFNGVWGVGLMERNKYNSMLRIQDEISKISLELDELRNEQKRRVSVLNYNDHSITTTVLEDYMDEMIEGEEIVGDVLEYEGVATIGGATATAEIGGEMEDSNVTLSMCNDIIVLGGGNKEMKVVKKRKANRRYFRRKHTGSREKNDFDEMEKMVRSRTPLDIITLASKHYLRKLKLNRDLEFNDFTLPVAQEYRRGPYMNIGEKNIRDIRSANLICTSTLGQNFSFLDDLSKCCYISSINFISKANDKATTNILCSTPYEKSIGSIGNAVSRGGTGGGNTSGIIGFVFGGSRIAGVEFVADDYVTRRNEEESFLDASFGHQAREFEYLEEKRGLGFGSFPGGTFELNKTGEGTEEKSSGPSVAREEESLDSVNNYSYLASVMENESRVFSLARQRVKVRVIPGRVREIEELSNYGNSDTFKKVKLRFCNSLREDGVSCRDEDCIEDSSRLDSNTKEISRGEEREFGVSNCFELLRKMDVERLDSLSRLSLSMREFDTKGATNDQVSFLVSTYNYLSEEKELLDNMLRSRQEERTITIFQDDIVVDGEMQDYYEIVLSVPENVSLMPYCTSLCYPLEERTTRDHLISGFKENTLEGKGLISRTIGHLRPINGSFYHPLNLFGVPEKIKRVREHIRKRKMFVKKELFNLRKLLPSVYSSYRRYVRSTEMQNVEKNREFTWGCLPVRAIDHPDQIVPLPIGYFKNSFRFKAYHKFLDLLPLYWKNDREKVFRMSSSNLLLPVSFSNSSRFSVFMIGHSSGGVGSDEVTGKSVVLQKNETEMMSSEGRNDDDEEQQQNQSAINLRRKRGVGGSSGLAFSTKRIKGSAGESLNQSCSSNGDDKGSGGRGFNHLDKMAIPGGAESLHNSTEVLRTAGVNMTLGAAGGSSGGGSSSSKDKEINTLNMKNREKEKEIVHLKQAQREWMQMTSSSSLIGPSPLWFESCIFKFPSEIEYSILDKDPVAFPNIRNTVSFTNNNNRIWGDIEEETDRNFNTIWSHSEVRLFIEKYLMYPKDFRRISSFMEHKNIKDCVDFYYKYKYSLGLKRILKLVHYFKSQSKSVQQSSKSGVPSNINSNQMIDAMSECVSESEYGCSDYETGDRNSSVTLELGIKASETTREGKDKFELNIWDSNVSTRKCIEIISKKKQSYREFLIDEILKTLDADKVYGYSMREMYRKCRFDTLSNMNFYNEKILSRSSLKRVLAKPHTIFRLPILEGPHLRDKCRQNGKSLPIFIPFELSDKPVEGGGVKRRERNWSVFDEMVYKSIFRIHDDGVYLNYNYLSARVEEKICSQDKENLGAVPGAGAGILDQAFNSLKNKYLLDNLSNGYILPKNIHSVISPVYNINIHNDSTDNTVSIPNNIPIIFQDHDFENSQILSDYIAEPKVSVNDLRASLFLYMNRFAEPNGESSDFGGNNGNENAANTSLFNSLTILPGKSKGSPRPDGVPSVNSLNNSNESSVAPSSPLLPLSNSNASIGFGDISHNLCNSDVLGSRDDFRNSTVISSSDTYICPERTRQTRKKRGLAQKDNTRNIGLTENRRNGMVANETTDENRNSTFSIVNSACDAGVFKNETKLAPNSEPKIVVAGESGDCKTTSFIIEKIGGPSAIGTDPNSTDAGKISSDGLSNISHHISAPILRTRGGGVGGSSYCSNPKVGDNKHPYCGNTKGGSTPEMGLNNTTTDGVSQATGSIDPAKFGLEGVVNYCNSGNNDGAGAVDSGVIAGCFPGGFGLNWMNPNQIQRIASPLFSGNAAVGGSSLPNDTRVSVLNSQPGDSTAGAAVGDCKQGWNSILMNQYLQQQLIFQQTLQEQFKSILPALNGAQSGSVDSNGIAHNNLSSSYAADFPSALGMDSGNGSAGLGSLVSNQSMGSAPGIYLNTTAPINQLISGNVVQGGANPTQQVHALITSLGAQHAKGDKQKSSDEQLLGPNQKYGDVSLTAAGDLGNSVLNGSGICASGAGIMGGNGTTVCGIGGLADYSGGSQNLGFGSLQVQPQTYQRNISQLQQMFQQQVLQQQLLQIQIQSQIQSLSRGQTSSHTQDQSQIQAQSPAQLQHLLQNQLKGSAVHSFRQHQQQVQGQGQSQSQSQMQLQLQNQIQAQIQTQIQNLIQAQIQVAQLQSQTRNQTALGVNAASAQTHIQMPMQAPQFQLQNVTQHLIHSALGGAGPIPGATTSDQLSFLYQQSGGRNSTDIMGFLQQQLQQLQHQSLLISGANGGDGHAKLDAIVKEPQNIGLTQHLLSGNASLSPNLTDGVNNTENANSTGSESFSNSFLIQKNEIDK